jgi:hypothetical protein
MAYGSTISSLETFLGDTFKSKVIQNPNYLLAFARFHIYSGKKNENEKSIRYDLAQLNLHADKIREFIIEETKEILNKINFQDVEKIYRLYNNILHIKLPNKLACFRENINNRHIIFHRNGKHIDGSDLNITILELLNLIKDVKEFIFSVNSSLKDLL